MKTDFAKETFTGLPPMARGIIAVAAVAGIGYLIYKVLKKADNLQNDKSIREENKQELAELEKENAARPATLTNAQAASLANIIFTAMDGYGTDEEAIMRALGKIKNNADYLKVSSAFDIKEISSGRFNPEPNFKGKLSGALTSELSHYWLSQVNKYFSSKGIRYSV